MGGKIKPRNPPPLSNMRRRKVSPAIPAGAVSALGRAISQLPLSGPGADKKKKKKMYSSSGGMLEKQLSWRGSTHEGSGRPERRKALEQKPGILENRSTRRSGRSKGADTGAGEFA